MWLSELLKCNENSWTKYRFGFVENGGNSESMKNTCILQHSNAMFILPPRVWLFGGVFRHGSCFFVTAEDVPKAVVQPRCPENHSRLRKAERITCIPFPSQVALVLLGMTSLAASAPQIQQNTTPIPIVRAEANHNLDGSYNFVWVLSSSARNLFPFLISFFQLRNGQSNIRQRTGSHQEPGNRLRNALRPGLLLLCRSRR